MYCDVLGCLCVCSEATVAMPNDSHPLPFAAPRRARIARDPRHSAKLPLQRDIPRPRKKGHSPVMSSKISQVKGSFMRPFYQASQSWEYFKIAGATCPCLCATWSLQIHHPHFAAAKAKWDWSGSEAFSNHIPLRLGPPRMRSGKRLLLRHHHQRFSPQTSPEFWWTTHWCFLSQCFQGPSQFLATVFSMRLGIYRPRIYLPWKWTFSLVLPVGRYYKCLPFTWMVGWWSISFRCNLDPFFRGFKPLITYWSQKFLWQNI